MTIDIIVFCILMILGFFTICYVIHDSLNCAERMRDIDRKERGMYR